MATKFRYPTGARPLLIEETAQRRRIESRFVALLEGAGYAEIVLPIIDFAEPYAALSIAGAPKQSYRFTDREGELVAIRSDFTPMVARALAPSIDAASLPLRVFYRGDVIRCEASRLGANRELFQIGAEIVGDASVEADVETLRLAADLASSLGLDPLVVYNDTSIATGFDDAAREALATKRAPRGVDPLAARLIAGSVALDDVRESNPACAARLEKIATALEGDNRFVLQLDDVEGVGSYYTGLYFRLFGGASGRRVARGGRYDSLYGRFGDRSPAVGFTFTLDDLPQPAGSAGEERS